MGKYEPLGQFLKRQNKERINISFAEIERVLGTVLPKSSKAHRAWWSNNASNNVMTRQWLDAGYETEQVDIAAERLVFRRKSRPAAMRRKAGERAPIFGCMKGMMTIAPGFDLTTSTGADWLVEHIGGLDQTLSSKP